MSDGIQNLQAAIRVAASAPFALDAAFLTSGLADPSIAVPAKYDAWLAAAFFADSAADFKVSVSAGNVGPVIDGAFQVTLATVPFIGSSAPLSAQATLVFATNTVGEQTELVVQIQTTPQGWTWTRSFQFMGGFPFDQLSVLNAQFIFSTAEGFYPWGDSTGRSVKGESNQNLFAEVPLPEIVKPYLALFAGLRAPAGNLVLHGVFDMSYYDGEKVLFPPGTFDAVLQGGTFQVFYLQVTDPRVSLTIPLPDGVEKGPAGELVFAEEDEGGDQSPLLSVSAGLGLQEEKPSPYVLQVQIFKSAVPGYQIGLTATKEDPRLLSPSAIISLVGAGGSYLAAVPPVLQQFLAFVSLRGLTLTGTLDPLRVKSVSVDLGSSPDTSWTIIPDPTGKLDFTIKSFGLQWTIADPFGKAPAKTYDFTTQFTLAPTIFKGPDGKGDGIFSVGFTSGQQYYAQFDGTAKLSDFLGALTGGAVTLEGIGDIQLSDISLALDSAQKSFSFSSRYAASLQFLTVDGKPVISVSDGQISVAARTATQPPSDALALRAPSGDPPAAPERVWQSSIGGRLAVGPLQADASVAYDGFAAPARWNLKASLAQPLDVSALINQFFTPGGSYSFPSFFPGDLKILTFDFNSVIPAKKGELATSYQIATSLRWTFQFGDQTVGIDPARLELAYDGSEKPGQQFSGLVEGTWVYSAINLKLLMGYQLKPTVEGTNNILYVEWQGFRAEWQSGQKAITFSLKGWSIGALIQALVRTLGDPYFTLPSPWDLLNQISLDGLRVIVSLEEGLSFTQRLSATYQLPTSINLGFIDITGITFRRDTDGKVTLAIEGSSPIKSQLGDLMDPKEGQDVKDLPKVPGRGEQWFKLFLLVLGQRVGITGYSELKNTQEVIRALQAVPQTTGKTNPVDPNADQGSQKGLPYYQRSNDWLIAGHLGLLQVGNAWTVDAQMVFDDPNLYGLRLALAGPKAGGLANLAIDVLYKKVTDDIGVYQIELTFPGAIRNLNFGTLSIVLPQIGVKVFTNGDFFIDIGFPYNLDFTRSFSLSTIVFVGPVPVPLLGAGGFYFGKLSNATSTQIPKTTLGTFDPVLEFGLGLQLGLGYNFVKGPLSAGFSITVFGIIEGVIAPWHPYDQRSAALARSESGGALQSDYFFKLSGTAGIIGLLYGSVDFAIISASVNVKITLSIQLTYQSYREIPIVARATVDISLRVKIDLGLFSISIRLSFSASVSATFKLGSNQRAPWDGGTQALAGAAFRSLTHGPDAAVQRARTLRPVPRRLAMVNGKEPLRATILPQFTVNAPEGSVDPRAQQGAFVLLLAMDAPDPTHSDKSGDTSFDKLARAFFPWIIDALAGSGDTVDLAEAAKAVVSAHELETYVTRLANTASPVLTLRALLQFLSDGFILDIRKPDSASLGGLDKGAMIFPVFDGLTLTVPASQGTGVVTIPFETYATATPSYRSTVAEIFAQVAARIEAENQERPVSAFAQNDAPDSMASLIFVDAFTMIGRQLLQVAADALANYALALSALGTDSSIDDVIRWAAAAGNGLVPDDVILPNAEHNLSPGIVLPVTGLSYTIQAGDTLSSIAGAYSQDGPAPRWTTSSASLITANADQRILAAGAELHLVDRDGKSVTVVTGPGDTFGQIAAELRIDVPALANQQALYDEEKLLAPTQPMLLSAIAYTTEGTPGGDASTDTLSSVAALFQTTPGRVGGASRAVNGLFSEKANGGLISVANLTALKVSDLWAAIAATNQVGQTAGMVSRFLTYGLRLPAQAGLSLSSDFLYPTGQKGYGLYQLSGQQFPTPATAASYAVTLSREDTSHGVKLASFIWFDGLEQSTSVAVPLADAFSRLGIVLDWARTGAFQPSPSLEVLPLSDVVPKAFAASTFALWSSSDMASLEGLTRRTAAGRDEAASAQPQPQPQPTLWSLPPGVLDLLQTRQAAIQSAVGGIKDALPFLPQLQPQVGKTSPASAQTDYSPLENWAWATSMDFEIKRLPATALPPGGTGADFVPEGAASAASLPNLYELVGPSSDDAARLKRILTAMDTLGEGIASGLFLLYNQSGPGAPVLVTPGSQEFLAFITQTNLSTETNPPAQAYALGADGAPPRGIANSASELIRLLWELSVVRSGGYYLYYQHVKSGEGLPAAVFDSSGSGKLRLVVAFAARGPNSFGRSVPDFVNALVTTDPIDVHQDLVQVASATASGQSAALKGLASETLRSLSAIYGPGPASIAEENSALSLTPGAALPVAGIVRQLRQVDVVDPSTTLANLARYYSAGAQTAITGPDIAAFNPGVAVAAGAVFYIPKVTYLVSATAAPGNTFGSTARYYGLPIAALATAAAEVGGIFPAGTRLALQTQLLDLRPQLGPGNLGIRLVRDNLGQPELPANPTPEQKAAYARAYLFQLYSLLSAGFAQNVYFPAKSPLGLPFGPQSHPEQASDSASQSAFQSAHSAMADRRSRLLAAEDAPFDYRQSLGFGKFARVNPAPDNSSAPDLPPRSDNPYVGVGSTSQVALQWQDLFGNVTITPFELPPAGNAGALNGSAATLLYGDRLIGMGEWPNTRASYRYAGSAGKPSLSIDLALDGGPYQEENGKAQAARDLRLYQKVYFQLHQDYTGAGVPGLTGNAVSLWATNSLLASPRLDFDPVQAETVRKFVREAVIYLQQIATGKSAAPPSASVGWQIDPAGLAGGNVLPLDVALTFQRDARLVEPRVAGLEGGLTVTTAVLPRADEAGAVSFKQFAEAMETVFQTSAYALKVGEGLKSDSAGPGQGTQQLWAVRFGKSAGQGIFFRIGDTPSYYAPRPIARSLVSRTAELINYRTGQKEQVAFSAADQNLWFQTCLDAIDAFLSANDAPHVFILDQLQGVKDPIEDGELGKVLKAKKSLADTISRSVEPILSTSAEDASTRWAAQEKLRQQLLNQLGAAMRSGATVVYGLSDVSGAPPVTPAGPPSLYGQPVGVVSPEARNSNYSLTPARIPLGPAAVKGVPQPYDPRVALVLTSKEVAEQAYVPLSLKLRVSHMELDRASVPGIVGYVQSRWLAFVRGPFDYDLGSGIANVPIVNRDLPVPPTVTSQSATRPDDPPRAPSDLTRWNYRADYLYAQAAQDAVTTRVELNCQPMATSSRGTKADGPDLFQALAQLVSSYPAVLSDFQQYLRKIDAAQPDPATLDGAKKAVDAFAAMVGDVATACAATRKTVRSAEAKAPDQVWVDFYSTLARAPAGEAPALAQTNILALTINDLPATWDRETKTISNGKITLHQVVIGILPDLYQAVPAPELPPQVSIAYRYQKLGDDPAYLTYEDALKAGSRRVILEGLDVLAHQSGWAALSVQRNRVLVPADQIGKVLTNPAFQFQTPTAKFANPVVPRLVYAEYSLDQMPHAQGDLRALLASYFQQLFVRGQGTTEVDVAMQGAYTYDLVPDVGGLPRVMLPIDLLPPSTATVDPKVLPPFVAPFSEVIESWLGQAALTGNPRIEIQQRIFGGAGDKQPILTVSNLFHAVGPSGKKRAS